MKKEKILISVLIICGISLIVLGTIIFCNNFTNSKTNNDDFNSSNDSVIDNKIPTPEMVETKLLTEEEATAIINNQYKKNNYEIVLQKRLPKKYIYEGKNKDGDICFIYEIDRETREIKINNNRNSISNGGADFN